MGKKKINFNHKKIKKKAKTDLVILFRILLIFMKLYYMQELISIRYRYLSKETTLTNDLTEFALDTK